MVALEDISIEMCPDCHDPTCLTIVNEDDTAVYICNNPKCKSIWDPSDNKIQTLLSIGLT